MASKTFNVTGDVNVQVTLTELPNDTLQFDIKVLDETAQSAT